MGRLPSSFAEYALMDKEDAIPVPANLSWEEAAATPLTYLVVYDMLVQQGNLKKGEWLLVTGVLGRRRRGGPAGRQGARREGHRHFGFGGQAQAAFSHGARRRHPHTKARFP